MLVGGKKNLNQKKGALVAAAMHCLDLRRCCMKLVENLESRDDPVKPQKGETPNCPGKKELICEFVWNL